MTDAFINRWTTSDGTEHGDWVIKWFEYTKTPKAPEVVKMYTERLRHLPVKELEVVCIDLQNPDYAKPILPGVEAILKGHRDRKKRRQERIEDAKKLRRKPVSAGERELARRATNAAFGNRLMRHMDFDLKMERPEYVGDFDYMAVANAAMLPKLDELPNNVHCLTRFWEHCWKIFDEEWSKYCEGN